MDFYNISVRDIKILTRLIKEKYNFDLDGFVTIPLRRKIVELYKVSGSKNLDELKFKIENKEIYEKELYSVFQFDTTEMFRDPSVWRFLFTYLSKKNDLPLKVWFPSCSDGYEMYSFIILLRVLNKDSNVEITISNPDKRKISYITEKIILPPKVYETSYANFKRLNLKMPLTLDNFFENADEGYLMKNSFKGKINIIESLEEKRPLKSQNLIVYRNKMLYYTVTKSTSILKVLIESLLPNGLLLIGVNENIKYFKEYGLSLLDEEDSIYKKR